MRGASRGGTSKPVSPFATSSGIPATVVETTGFQLAIASAITVGKTSLAPRSSGAEARTKTSQSRNAARHVILRLLAGKMNSFAQILPAGALLQLLAQSAVANNFAIEIYSSFVQFRAGIDQNIETLERRPVVLR